MLNGRFSLADDERVGSDWIESLKVYKKVPDSYCREINDHVEF